MWRGPHYLNKRRHPPTGVFGGRGRACISAHLAISVGAYLHQTYRPPHAAWPRRAAGYDLSASSARVRRCDCCAAAYGAAGMWHRAPSRWRVLARRHAADVLRTCGASRWDLALIKSSAVIVQRVRWRTSHERWRVAARCGGRGIISWLQLRAAPLSHLSAANLASIAVQLGI